MNPIQYKSITSTADLITAKELQKQLNLSWNSIQKYFFHYENFPKRKIGNKWYFHKDLLNKFLLDYYTTMDDPTQCS